MFQNIAKNWNLQSKSESEIASEVLRLGQTLYQAVLVKSLDILSVEDEEQLDAILDLDTTTTEQVIAFLKSKIPTFDLLVVEERQKLKEATLFTKV